MVNYEQLNKQRLCLYDAEWQALRISLLGKWNSVRSIETNLNELGAYLFGDGGIISNTVAISRMWRVLNLLNAVRMGHHGMSAQDTEMSERIVMFRDTLSDQYEFSEEHHWDKSSWEVPTEYTLLDDLSYVPRNTVEAIWADLVKRRNLALYKNGSYSRQEAVQKVARSRPELCWALRIYAAAAGKRYEPLEMT